MKLWASVDDYAEIATQTGTTIDFVKECLSNVEDHINQAELLDKVRVEKSMQILRAIKLLEPTLGKSKDDLLSALNINKETFNLPYLKFSREIIIHINKFMEDISKLRKEILVYYIYNISSNDSEYPLEASIDNINIDPEIIKKRLRGDTTPKSVEQKKIDEASQKFVGKYNDTVICFEDESKILKEQAPKGRSSTVIGRIFSGSLHHITDLAKSLKNVGDMRAILIYTREINDSLKRIRSIADKNDRDVLQ